MVKDKEVWYAAVHGITKSLHDWATEQQQQQMKRQLHREHDWIRSLFYGKCNPHGIIQYHMDGMHPVEILHTHTHAYIYIKALETYRIYSFANSHSRKTNTVNSKGYIKETNVWVRK